MWRIAAAGALSAGLAMAQFLVPVAGPALGVFTPVPLLWLAWRAGLPEGRRWHMPAAALVAAALPVLLVGPDLALGLLVQFGPMTAGLAIGLARSWSVTAAVSTAAGLTVAIGFAALLIRSGFDPAAAAEAVTGQVERVVTAALARTAGDAVEAEQLVAVFVRLLPGLAVAGTAAGAWANLFALRWGVTGGWRPGERRDRKAPAEGPPAGDGADRRGHRERPPLDDWSRWAAPEPLVFVLILGGAALLVGKPAATTAGLNLLLVVGFVYFLQGLAIVGFFFRAKRVPTALRIAGYLLIGAQQLLALAVAVVGLADLWVDFRRRALRPPRSSPG